MALVPWSSGDGSAVNQGWALSDVDTFVPLNSANVCERDVYDTHPSQLLCTRVHEPDSTTLL